MTFKITDGKGMHFTFPNGYTVSLQMGPGNYSDNHDLAFDWYLGNIRKNPLPRSNTVEVAYWYKDSSLLPMPEPSGVLEGKDYHDTVAGYWNITRVMQFLNFVQGLEPGKHPLPPAKEETNNG